MGGSWVLSQNLTNVYVAYPHGKEMAMSLVDFMKYLYHYDLIYLASLQRLHDICQIEKKTMDVVFCGNRLVLIEK